MFGIAASTTGAGAAARRAVAGPERGRALVRSALPATGAPAVLDESVRAAFAVAARPGPIVVTCGMLRELDAEQRRAMLAPRRLTPPTTPEQLFDLAQAAYRSTPR